MHAFHVCGGRWPEPATSENHDAEVGRSREAPEHVPPLDCGVLGTLVSRNEEKQLFCSPACSESSPPPRPSPEPIVSWPRLWRAPVWTGSCSPATAGEPRSLQA